MAGDDDEPKRSWREIDKMRDKSEHRREGGGGGPRPERLERSQAYRAYKTQLNKVFEGGGLPEAMKSKLEESGVGAEAKRQKALAQAIVAAATPAATRAALAEYRAAFGFPSNEDVLSKLLELEDVPVVLETLATLDGLVAGGGLRRSGSLKARVKTAQMTLDSPKVTEAARALLVKL